METLVMEKLKEVKKLENVAKLEGDHKEEQVKILQEIGAELVNEYIIKVGALTIEPLLVEAYYYHQDKFPDLSVHAARKNGKIAQQAHERQQKNLNKLYVHCPNGSGIDVCLTDSDEYYLSFLIKNAIVNNQWKTQLEIADELCGQLYKRDQPRNSKVIYLPRKGISGDFACFPLAALPLNKILDYDFTLPNGYQKQWRTAVYALVKENMDEEKARQLVKNKQLSNSQIQEKYWMLAKETLANN